MADDREKAFNDILDVACKAFSESEAVYPDGSAATQITDWFRLDAQDAVDFGVLKEPKWGASSDVRGMQHEWYVASVIKEPMRAALSAALSLSGWKLVPEDPTPEMQKAGFAALGEDRECECDQYDCYLAMVAAAPAGRDALEKERGE